jgi:hypothetical protein
MAINPKSPLENGLPLAAMSRKDQKLELRMVKEELREKLEAAQSAQANNMLSVARRKKKSLGYVDEFDKCLVAYMRRFRQWIEADKDDPSLNPDATLVKDDLFTGELKDRRMQAFAKLMLTRELILNEASKMPSMPEMPEIGTIPVLNQTNNQININVPPDSEGGYNASEDFKSFRKAKGADAG